MTQHLPNRFSRKSARILAIVCLAVLGACSTPDSAALGPDGIHDPLEADNRAAHAFNKDLDRALVRPVAMGYAAVIPDGVQNNVSHFAANLSVPGAVINKTLQGDLGGAFRNSLRFGVNSTLGFAGLMDVASSLGLPEDDADFGQTLAVWGAPQGAYLELPVLGPTTERDALGRLVDYATNPLRGLASPKAEMATAGRIAAGLGARGRYVSTIDALLYDSVDSYAASRDLYLQNRAFELEKAGVTTQGEADPYADLFGE